MPEIEKATTGVNQFQEDMMRRFLAVVVFSLLAIALFASGVFAADQKPGRDGNITVVQALDMISFDPTATSDLNNQYVLYNIYSRLFTYPQEQARWRRQGAVQGLQAGEQHGVAFHYLGKRQVPRRHHPDRGRRGVLAEQG